MSCGCEHVGKPKAVRYKCTCEDDCGCPVIEFDKEPQATPYCCGEPMKRVK